MLKFNDIDLAELGVLVIEDFPIPTSQLRYEEQVIPGRDGVITITDGSYEGCEITGRVVIRLNDNYTLDDIKRALQGWGRLMIPGVQDRYFIAKVNNLIPIDQFIKNEVYEMPLTFKCQPFGYLLSGYDEVTAASGTITNIGNVIARPTFTCTKAGSVTITINERTFRASVTEGTIIDCELEEVVDTVNHAFTASEGVFPYLDLGENTVTISGSMKVQWNWRCL
jgi:phage-related protein